MTNLEIIKYLATNNPTRLAELLDDIYCNAWNCGSCAASTGKVMEDCEIDDFDKWLHEDADKRDYYYDYELEQWSKVINPTPTIEATYGNLTVTIPVGDPNHMWNKNNDYDYKMETVETAIDEIKLLDTILKSEEIPDNVYDSFRTEECVRCADPNCMVSDMEICGCHKFANYFEV
jgi:hypothetical protein